MTSLQLHWKSALSLPKTKHMDSVGGGITHRCLLETVLQVAIAWSRDRENYHNLAAMHGATLTTVEKAILMKTWEKIHGNN